MVVLALTTSQVVYFHKKYGFVTLYITATDKRECADWTACLRQGMTACSTHFLSIRVSSSLLHKLPSPALLAYQAVFTAAWAGNEGCWVPGSDSKQTITVSLTHPPADISFLLTLSALYVPVPSACYFNQDMLMHYHPGALLKGKWSCCQQRNRTSLGCQPTYHLLTRSSSRYAQMRRRDTLSSSHGHRRSKTGRSFEDRRSVASGTQNDADAVQVEGMSGAGLSNSCFDLTQRPPHKLDTFAQDIPPSRRSSRQSTEPSGSVGIDSITLTRVSLVDTGALDAGSEEMESGTSSEPKEGGPSRDENRSSRCQVAPEMSHFPIHSLRPLEPEQKAVPGTRPRGKSLGNGGFPSSQREGSHPPFPSRYRSSVPTTSASFHGIFSVTPIGEHQEPGASRMKHSQTFVATSSIIPSAQHCKLSSSMSALCQPLISPRISHTDPNIIHV